MRPGASPVRGIGWIALLILCVAVWSVTAWFFLWVVEWFEADLQEAFTLGGILS